MLRSRWIQLTLQLTELRAKIEVNGILTQAQALRQGHTCSAPDPSTRSSGGIMGGTNIHIPLTFDDGAKWLSRIRHNICHPYPIEALRRHAQSEAATYRTLKDAGVGVPETWVPGEDGRSEHTPVPVVVKLKVDPDLA